MTTTAPKARAMEPLAGAQFAVDVNLGGIAEMVDPH